MSVERVLHPDEWADDPSRTHDADVYLATEHSNGKEPGADLALAFRPLADVEMKSIEWLEKPLWQCAAFELVAGKKGCGKGTYLARLSARVSRGELFDKPMNVLLLASEDSDEIDLKPRVVAAGGDPERIYTLTESFSLPRDIPKLEQAARKIGDVGLIIFDPISSYTDAKPGEGAKVRAAIGPLNALAHKLGCLVVGVRHLGKDTARGALSAVLDSVEWVNVPRAVLVFAEDDEQPMTFHVCVASGNRSARGAGRVFRLELADVGLKEPVTRAIEIGESSKSVDDLLGQTPEERRAAVKRDGAADIILRELAAEPRPLDYLKAKCAAEIGASGDTTWRAANALRAEGRIDRRNSGPGSPWLWFLTSAEELSLSLQTEVTKDSEYVPKSEPDFLTSASQLPLAEQTEVTNEADDDIPF